MSAILKRTVFIERDPRENKGFIRCADWASVVTRLGQMFEPFHFNSRGFIGSTQDGCNWDSEDEMQRVDNIFWITDTSMNSMPGFKDDDWTPSTRGATYGHLMHGGWMIPRATGSR